MGGYEGISWVRATETFRQSHLSSQDNDFHHDNREVAVRHQPTGKNTKSSHTHLILPVMQISSETYPYTEEGMNRRIGSSSPGSASCPRNSFMTVLNYISFASDRRTTALGGDMRACQHKQTKGGDLHFIVAGGRYNVCRQRI